MPYLDQELIQIGRRHGTTYALPLYKKMALIHVRWVVPRYASKIMDAAIKDSPIGSSLPRLGDFH